MKNFKIIALITLTITFAACKSAKYPSLEDGLYADIQTTKGDIVVMLEYDKTPMTVANFVSLTEGENTLVDEKYKDKRYYDGVIFHRVIKDFMIQSGDPEGTGKGGTGYKFGDEFPTDDNGNLLLLHDAAGIMSMANSGPSTNSSQFFITHKETPHLDGKHSVFGHVVIGQEVVDSIVKDDVINRIDIIRNGRAAKSFNASSEFNNGIETFEEEMKKKAEELEARAKNAEVAMKEMGAFIEENKPTAKKFASGLQMMTVKKGTGVKPTIGNEVYIDYSGFFEDGRMFGTSNAEMAKKFNTYDERADLAKQYQPFSRVYSKEAKLIPGFREAMLKMEFGERAILFIPSHLAYGEKGAGRAIPPNADLIFEIEIMDNRD